MDQSRSSLEFKRFFCLYPKLNVSLSTKTHPQVFMLFLSASKHSLIGLCVLPFIQNGERRSVTLCLLFLSFFLSKHNFTSRSSLRKKGKKTMLETSLQSLFQCSVSNTLNDCLTRGNFKSLSSYLHSSLYFCMAC